MSINRQAASDIAAQRKNARAAGLFYLITHVTSIGAFALYEPILSSTSYLTGSGAETQMLIGAFFEVILALTAIGTAIALYPAAKKQSEGLALGYVALRTLEAAIIVVGVMPLLVLVTLRYAAGTASTDPATLATLGNALASLHNWTLLLGPGLICGTNTVVMAYLMFRSGLVPKFIPTLGLIGGPLIFAISAAQIVGIYDHAPAWMGIAVLPIFAWEVTLALWLIVKGFRSPAAMTEMVNPVATERLIAA